MTPLETNLEEFNRTLSRYAEVYDPNGWFRADVLTKKGAQIGFAWQKRLDQHKPGNGEIRSERIAALKAGEGVKVRESVQRRVASRLGLRSRLSDKATVFGKRGVRSRLTRGNRVNFQALAVKAELNLRERGIGFTRYASRIRGLAAFAAAREKKITNGKWQQHGRYNQLLAEAGLRFDGLTLKYGSPQSEAGAALQTPDAQASLAEAIADVTADMDVYLARKANEAAKEAGFK